MWLGQSGPNSCGQYFCPGFPGTHWPVFRPTCVPSGLQRCNLSLTTWATDLGGHVPAQQKAKSDAKRGTRNGDRRNGKSWSRNSDHDGTAFMPVTRPAKGYLGYSFKRIDKMAAEAGVDRTTIMQTLYEKRQKRIEYRRSMSPSLRRQLANSIKLRQMRQKLYSN